MSRCSRLGVSHAPLVEATGQAYTQPLAKMREFLDGLPPVSAPIVLAALGPKMLELSRDRALGAHPYFSPPEHTAFARSVLGAAPLLVPEQAVTLEPDGAGRGAGRAYAKYYLRLDAGADHVVLQPVAEEGGFAPGQLDELASVVSQL